MQYQYKPDTFRSCPSSLDVENVCFCWFCKCGYRMRRESCFFTSLVFKGLHEFCICRTKTFPDESSDQSDGADNYLVQLEELFDEIKLMIKMGRKRNARDLLQANYELVKEQIVGGAKDIEQAATLDIVALGHMLLGDLKSVGRILNTLQEIVEFLNDDTPVLDLVLTHMGSMYSALGKYNKSTLVYQRGIRLLEKKYELYEYVGPRED
ncbi:hypothetical protein LINGRAHAP2_LOCUS32421 [Linum grandiflorum]